MKRSTDKNVRTPFAVFAVGKTCFMVGVPCFLVKPQARPPRTTRYVRTRLHNLPESYNGTAYELLPSSLAYLTNYGYPSSINVKEIIIPRTIKMIPEYTFSESNITDIHYLGTKAEWNNLILEKNWDSGISSTKIHCTDGDVE